MGAGVIAATPPLCKVGGWWMDDTTRVNSMWVFERTPLKQHFGASRMNVSGLLRLDWRVGCVSLDERAASAIQKALQGEGEAVGRRLCAVLVPGLECAYFHARKPMHVVFALT